MLFIVFLRLLLAARVRERGEGKLSSRIEYNSKSGKLRLFSIVLLEIITDFIIQKLPSHPQEGPTGAA